MMTNGRYIVVGAILSMLLCVASTMAPAQAVIGVRTGWDHMWNTETEIELRYGTEVRDKQQGEGRVFGCYLRVNDSADVTVQLEMGYAYRSSKGDMYEWQAEGQHRYEWTGTHEQRMEYLEAALLISARATRWLRFNVGLQYGTVMCAASVKRGVMESWDWGEYAVQPDFERADYGTSGYNHATILVAGFAVSPLRRLWVDARFLDFLNTVIEPLDATIPIRTRSVQVALAYDLFSGSAKNK